MSVWAQATKHLNLYYKSKQLYIGLYDEKCNVDKTFEGGTCLRSYVISLSQSVRSAFYKAVNGTVDDDFKYWVQNGADASKKQSTMLNLATDIDFGQTLDSEGNCSENFDFLPFSGLSFNGHNHMMSNFCRIDNGQTKRYLGLFGDVVGDQTNGKKTIRDLIISNVHFAVTSGEPALTSGGDYQPAGALAARISNSTVTNVKLKDVVIQAPLAGGLAGFIENSTIKDISTVDNSFIKVTNGISITEDYIGKAIYKYGENVAVFDPYKVLLGGLAGAAYFTNFEDIDLAVQVENKAAVDMSALGGLVGHYVYAPKSNQFSQVTNRDSKITKVNIHGSSSDVGVNAFISGGTAMGGILGASRRLDNNNSPITEFSISQSKVTNLDIKQSKIKINDPEEKQNLYFGGLVGNSDLCSGGILKVTESTVENIDIKESVQEDAAFQYYMGGIAGYASCSHINNSANRDDLYLTIQNTTASGKITLEGGYSKTGKASSSVRMSAAMGGLVGDAIVSLEKNGISGDVSNVSITYKAKRAENDVDLDSVLVGGIFGGVSLFNSQIDYIRLDNMSYKDSMIHIEDDGIIARVGGIVGKFPMIQSGNSKIEFSNIQVKGDSEKDNNIVSYSGETKSSNTSSSIGGICGMCLSPREISKSSVDGNFKGSSGTDAPKKDFHVGGLIGTVDAKADIDIIKNNYFIGSIENKLNKSGSKGKAGYLFGHLTGDGLGNKPKIISNFHYGSDNVKAIGYFYNYGEYNNVMYFNEIQNGVTFDKFVAKNNVRNGATENFNENGNGYVTEAYMNTKDFAVFLNGPWSEDEAENRVWSWSSGTNGDFPFFGDSPVLTYTVRFLDGNSHELASGEVSFGGSAESLAPETSKIPKLSGACFSGWNASIDKVFKSMDVYPLYEAGNCKYTVTFNGLDGKPLENVVAEDGTSLKNPQEVEEGKAAILPKGPARVGNNCFLKWDDEDPNNDYTNVTHNIVVSAISKECYDVTFYDMDGNRLKNAKTKDGKDLDNPQVVDKGSPATAPKDPEPTADGKCFSGWSVDFSNVTKKLSVEAKWKTCEYTVKFSYLKTDGSGEIKEQSVKHNEGATPPADIPQKTTSGTCFTGWKADGDYAHVTANVNVIAQYEPCKYTVKFMYTDNKGVSQIVKTETVVHGGSATAPKDDEFPKKIDDQCFVEWKPDFSDVRVPLNVTAKYETCQYTVTFVYKDSDGVDAEKTETVVHGKDATAPENVAKKIGDQCFVGWKANYTEVTENLTIEAEYKTCETSSSSSIASSSSNSSSSANQSSSSENTQQSSSSTITPASSSSERYIVTIAKPTATQNDNALTMIINDTLADKHSNVDYHIVVESDAGTYLDTVVNGKVVGDIKNGTWKLNPVPAGDYKVTFTLTDGSDSVTTPTMTFKGETTKQVNLASNSWQTYSLYAFCNNKNEDCASVLEERLSRQQETWAIEECQNMREELKRGDIDEEFRKHGEEACRIASEAQTAAVTSVYWWDETNPVGDYWQYRKFDAKQDFDSTRGYWYGAVNDEELTLGLQTPNMNDEIVWKLKNNYSGWNLVANPFGWFVNLPQEDNLEFKKWNPNIGDYDTVGTLGPYEAIWVHTDKTREYRIPMKATIVLDGEKKAPLHKKATSESWNLRVVLTDKNGKRDYWNELAAGSVALSKAEPPAGMGDRVNLSIVEGKQRLAKSVKKNSDDLEWNLEASATTYRDGQLKFEGLESVWAKGLRVYATVGGETVEVVKDSPVNVKLSSKAKNVTVRVTKGAAPVNVAKNLISGFRVNQMQNALNVGFDAVSNLAGSKVKVSIVGVDGRVVATSGAVAKEGSNAISMKKPKQGVYFVRLKVGSQVASARFLVH
jgi:hypothetical protein